MKDSIVVYSNPIQKYMFESGAIWWVLGAILVLACIGFIPSLLLEIRCRRNEKRWKDNQE